MESLSQLALAGGLAWASGIRLYVTILVVGLLGRYGYLDLPESLALLQHTWVLSAAAVMAAGFKPVPFRVDLRGLDVE